MYACVLTVFYGVACMCAYVEGYQSYRTDTTSSFQTEHQLQSSLSSFNANTICVCVVGN